MAYVGEKVRPGCLYKATKNAWMSLEAVKNPWHLHELDSNEEPLDVFMKQFRMSGCLLKGN